MKLESLANEVLLEVFDSIEAAHLLSAFYGLNARFNSLLLRHFQSHSLDFRSMSKTIFTAVCQHHLPTMLDQIVSLRLSNDDETPKQIEHFFSSNLTLNQFTRLKSLALFDIPSEVLMKTMLDQLRHLSNLTHFDVIRCYFRSQYIDEVWALPALTHFNLNSFLHIDLWVTPTITSQSLQHLFLLGRIDHSIGLDRLFQCTPCLRRLSLTSLSEHLAHPLSSIFSSLEIFTVSFDRSTSSLEQLLRHLPNLRQLTVTASNMYVDGQWWEKIITDHLSKLKRFRLLMQFEVPRHLDSTDQVDQILDSFRSRFWLDEHQWFVRCHWSLKFAYRSYCLYTLPYMFNEFLPNTNMQSKSTCPYEFDKDYSYDHVRRLSCGSHLSPDFLHLQFVNLYELNISLPVPHHFSRAISSLHHLRILSVWISTNSTEYSSLQALLHRASCLYTLKLHSAKSPLHVLPIGLASTTIRRLELQCNCQPFDEQTCHGLCRLPLAIRCEVLAVVVKHRTSILDLIHHLKHLRVLRVLSNDDEYNLCNSLATKEDELVTWLQQRLPMTCTISRAEDRYIWLWIQ